MSAVSLNTLVQSGEAHRIVYNFYAFFTWT